MIAIVCLDENNGMFFNERRQSKDRYVIRDIVHMVENNTLYINEYSKELFENTLANIQISEDYFNQVSDNEYCFIENQIVDILKAKKVVVYRWDKVYPADYKLPLRQYNLVITFEFLGYSNDKFVKELYERNETIKK